MSIEAFLSDGEPVIRVMADGSLYVVFEFMPPSDAEDVDDFGPFKDFDKQLERAVGVSVAWEDREVFMIRQSKADTVDKIQAFVEGYRKR